MCDARLIRRPLEAEPVGCSALIRLRSMHAAEAMSFVRQHGMVLVSAKGPALRLTEAIGSSSTPAGVPDELGA
jgi:hypothetical protein